MAVLKPVLAALRVLAAVLAAILAMPEAAGAQAAASEHDVKAAFVYNFTKFVEWPASAFPDAQSPLQLCVLGDDRLARALQAVAGEEVGGRRLNVVRTGDAGRLAGCHTLFIGPAEEERASRVLSSLRGEPVLTVGDARGFIERGGIINFVLEGSKIRFEINQESAERAGLKISAKLLRLAVRVAPETRPGP